MVLSQKTYQFNDNVELFFTDSGAPPTSPVYIIVVAGHGFGFPGDATTLVGLSAPMTSWILSREVTRHALGSREFIEKLDVVLFLRKLTEGEDFQFVSDTGKYRKTYGRWAGLWATKNLILYDLPFIVLGLRIPASINPEKLYFPHAIPNVK
ncbi:hypothetical protein V5O48_009443 [Marasmius crinis-equi]|uniref:Uncharacterized protein n=1 Tax=Marasmius crinis-equi TaxID=585013 RepID=A0ABR3FBF4_9AGAR